MPLHIPRRYSCSVTVNAALTLQLNCGVRRTKGYNWYISFYFGNDILINDVFTHSGVILMVQSGPRCVEGFKNPITHNLCLGS